MTQPAAAPRTDDLPDDIDALKALILSERAERQVGHRSDQLLINHLKLEIARLRRDKFGPRSERTARLLDQLELQLEELESTVTEDDLAAELALVPAQPAMPVAAHSRKRPSRQPFPAHLPRGAAP